MQRMINTQRWSALAAVDIATVSPACYHTPQLPPGGVIYAAYAADVTQGSDRGSDIKGSDRGRQV